MKLGQNVCLNEILDKFENGSCMVKNLVYALVSTCQSDTLETWSENLSRMISKTRSLGQKLGL